MPPRNIARQVTGSTLVTTAAQVDVLAKFLDVQPAQLKLTALFSTRNSGWEAGRFHAACDQQGATFTLVKTGNLYHGGYASVSWASSNQFLADGRAFLFRFKCCGKQSKVQESKKFDRLNQGNEVFAHHSYGPVFGYKFDLFTFGGGQQALSEVRHGGQPSFNIPHSSLFFDSTDRSMGNSVLEVLKVETNTNVAMELEESWSNAFPWTAEAVQQLQDKVFKYDPRQAGLSVPNFNILLCGGVGAGKSSFISTVDSICKDRISRRAPHGQGTGSLTRYLHKYKLVQPGSGEEVKWQLWDSMGWGADDYKRGEMAFILDGNLPDMCDLSLPVSTKTDGFNATPSFADRVHCVLFAVPCNAATDESYMTRLQEMRQFAREREIPTLLCLTKIDTYDPDVIGNDLAKTFHSSRLLELVEELEETAGVGGRKDILPIKSLSKESGPTTELSALVCAALQQCLYASEDYVTEYGSTLRTELSD